MGKIIKVRCTGPGRHINEVDLGDLLQDTPIYKFAPSDNPSPFEEFKDRYEKVCRGCTYKVVVTREMINDASKK